jgi:hypothetical protein
MYPKGMDLVAHALLDWTAATALTFTALSIVLLVAARQLMRRRWEAWLINVGLVLVSLTAACSFFLMEDSLATLRSHGATVVLGVLLLFLRNRLWKSQGKTIQPLAILPVPLGGFLLSSLVIQDASPLFAAIAIFGVQCVSLAIWATSSPPPSVPAEERAPTPPSTRAVQPIAAPVSNRIFVSYRREDSQDISGRIYDRLVQRFGKDKVFKDVDSVPLGVDFRRHLQQVVGACDVLLAVIGDAWLAPRIEGGRRLDDTKDYVRIELETALLRDIPVIPILVRGSRIPAESELPSTLGALPYRNGIVVRSDPDFHRDVDRLIEGLDAHLRRKA